MSCDYRKDFQLKNHRKLERTCNLESCDTVLLVNTCCVPAYSQGKEVFGRNFCCVVFVCLFFLPGVESLPVWSKYVVYNQIVIAGGSACTVSFGSLLLCRRSEGWELSRKKRACVLYIFFCIQCDAHNRQSWNQDFVGNTLEALINEKVRTTVVSFTEQEILQAGIGESSFHI